MAGHVYRNPGEKGWRVQIDFGIDPGTGKRVRVRLPGRAKEPFATRKEAKEAAARVVIERAEGRVADSRYATVSQFLLDRWLPARVARGLKPTTLASYEWVVKTYINPRIGDVKLVDLRPPQVTAMLIALGTEPGRGGRARSVRTVELTRRVMTMALSDAVRWGLIGRNPVAAAEADLPRSTGGRKPLTVWTPAQIRAFLTATRQDRLYGLWLLAATTGMRRGELCGLEWDDVKLDSARLTVRRNRVMVAGRASSGTPKTASGARTISLDSTTVEALRATKRHLA